MVYDCFLSYATADVVIAEMLYRRLTAGGVSVWFDKARLEPGFDWHREIETACEASRIVLPLLTPRWKQSEWTKYETYGAEAIIPLVAEGRFEDVATPPLRRVQAASIVTTGGAEAPGLLDAIRTRLAEPPLDATDRRRRLAHLRYRPTEYFVGRERDLDHLHEQLHVSPSAALTQGRVQAVTALGGVGKTTLARMYAEKFWRAYEVILWVDARLGYESEFARLLDVLRPDLAASLRDVPGAQRAARARREIDVLASSHPLMTAGLLIIDNAQDEQTAAAWVPSAGNVHTIITSRYAHWEAVPVCHIDVLAPEPARALLLQRSGAPDPSAVPAEERAACDVLAGKLGYLPLALEQAAAYVRAQGAGFGFADYLRLYADGESALLSMPVRGTTEYPESVFLTWQATVAKLPAGARAMLRLAAFLAPTEIPLRFFQDSADHVSTLAREFVEAPPHAVGGDAPAELRVRAWRGALADYSMAQTPLAATMTLHALVQAVERGQLDVETRQRWLIAAIDLFLAHAPADAEEFEQWAAWRVLLPHAEALVAGARASGVQPVPTDLLRRMSGFLFGQGKIRHAEALRLAQLVLRQDEAVFGPEHPSTLSSLSNLAALLSSQGENAAAEPLCRRALEASERTLGPEHPHTLTSVNNLATLLSSQGDYAAAEPLCRRALEASERTLGPEHPQTLASVHKLAYLLMSQGNYAAAEPLYRHGLEARERVLGPEHPDTLAIVHNLAYLLETQGAYAAAEPLYRRAIEARERVLGPEHPDTLTSVNNLAALLSGRGAHTAAETLFHRVLEARERVLGPEHPDTLASVHNLAYLLEGQGAYAAAEPLYRRAFEACERVLGPGHLQLDPEHPNVRSARANWQRCKELIPSSLRRP